MASNRVGNDLENLTSFWINEAEDRPQIEEYTAFRMRPIKRNSEKKTKLNDYFLLLRRFICVRSALKNWLLPWRTDRWFPSLIICHLFNKQFLMRTSLVCVPLTTKTERKQWNRVRSKTFKEFQKMTPNKISDWIENDLTVSNQDACAQKHPRGIL